MRTTTVGRQVPSTMRTKLTEFCANRSLCVRISAKTLRTKRPKIANLGSNLWANMRGAFCTLTPLLHIHTPGRWTPCRSLAYEKERLTYLERPQLSLTSLFDHFTFVLRSVLIQKFVLQAVTREKSKDYSRIIYAVCLFSIAAFIYQVRESRVTREDVASADMKA
jgi:hypothetical protein